MLSRTDACAYAHAHTHALALAHAHTSELGTLIFAFWCWMLDFEFSDQVHGSHFRWSSGGCGCFLGCLNFILAKSHVDPMPAANVMFETKLRILEMGSG